MNERKNKGKKNKECKKKGKNKRRYKKKKDWLNKKRQRKKICKKQVIYWKKKLNCQLDYINQLKNIK